MEYKEGPLSEEQFNYFHEHGYLILKDVFQEEDARNLCSTLLYLVQAQECPDVVVENFSGQSLDELRSLVSECLLKLEDINHDYIRNIYDTLRETSMFRKMVEHPALTDAAAQLMGLPNNIPLFFSQCACRMDPPAENPFALDWHQEVHYTFKDTELVQMWSPAIRPIGKGEGAIHILPKSHKIGVAKTTDTKPEFGHAQYTVVQDIVDKFENMEVQLEFGDALLFSNSLIHKSGENVSDLMRLTLIAKYYNATTPRFYENVNPHTRHDNPYAETN